MSCPKVLLLACFDDNEIRIEDASIVSLLVNKSKNPEELLKAFFSENFNQTELILYAIWNDFPLMKCL